MLRKILVRVDEGRDVGFPTKAGTKVELGGAGAASEGKTQRCGEGAVAGEFWGQVERIELIVFVGQVEQPEPDFRLAPREPIPSIEIEVPEVVSGQVDRIALV